MDVLKFLKKPDRLPKQEDRFRRALETIASRSCRAETQGTCFENGSLHPAGWCSRCIAAKALQEKGAE